MQHVTLVVLAGGRSTRYGRPKQLEPVGADGAVIMDLTMDDAFAAGCTAAVIVCRPEHEAAFHERFANDTRITAVVQQEALGTAHAVLVALDTVEGTVVVANGDDHYGAGAMRTAVEFASTTGVDHALVAFALGRTLSPSGGVNRAVCHVAEGQLVETTEVTGLQELNGVILDDRQHAWPDDVPVSMNLWVMRPGLKKVFSVLFAAHDPTRGEFGLPTVVQATVQQGHRFHVLATDATWCGLTRPGDRAFVQEELTRRVSLRTHTTIEAVCGAYGIAAERSSAKRLGHGLINATYHVPGSAGSAGHVVQQVNTTVFPDPGLIAANIDRAVEHLQVHHPAIALVAPLRTVHGRSFHRDGDGNTWRVFQYVAGSTTILAAPTADQAEQAARAFGQLVHALSGAPVKDFHITLPGFHDLLLRHAQFLWALEAAPPDRLASAAHAIDQLQSHADLLDTYRTFITHPQAPLRVVHNDTKLGNVLFQMDTGVAMHVIDLDTLMPGHALFDLGDMVRTYVPTRPEDDADTAALRLNNALYRAVMQGWCGAMAAVLTPWERDHLHMAGPLVVYEQAMRFLTDHLQGDEYYRTTRPHHNLERAHNQLAVLGLLLDKLDEHRAIVQEVLRASIHADLGGSVDQ